MSISVDKRAAAAGTPGFLRQQRSRFGEKLVFAVLLTAALVSVATTLGIVISLFVPAAEFFNEVPIGQFLTGTEWSPTFADPQFGVLPLVIGTLLTTLIAVARGASPWPRFGYLPVGVRRRSTPPHSQANA